MKTCASILLLLIYSCCSSQTTTNLILNNDFESVNRASPSYQASSHEGDIRDSSFQTTSVPCWVSADWTNQAGDYDTFAWRTNPLVLASVYPESGIRCLGAFSG